MSLPLRGCREWCCIVLAHGAHMCTLYIAIWYSYGIHDIPSTLMVWAWTGVAISIHWHPLAYEFYDALYLILGDFVVPIPSCSHFLPWISRYCLDPKYNAVLDPAIAFEIQPPGGRKRWSVPWGSPKHAEKHGIVDAKMTIFGWLPGRNWSKLYEIVGTPEEKMVKYV